MQYKKGLQYIVSLATSIAAVVINYLMALVLTHYITTKIGTEAYGFVSLAKEFASYASIATVALNAFAARYISVNYHKADYAKANQYFSSLFCADLFIAGILCLVAICVICHLQYVLAVPEYLLDDVKLLFVLDVLNFGVLSCTTVFMAATIIADRLDLAGIIKCVAYMLEGIILILLFSMFQPKLHYVGIGLLISSICLLVANAIMCKKLTPKLQVSKSYYSWHVVVDVLKKGLWTSFNHLGNLLNSGLDLFVANLMISPYASGQLAIVKTISTIATTLFQLVAQPLQPTLVKHYAHENKQELVKILRFSIKVNGMLSNILFAGFVAWGSVYYNLLTPGEDIRTLHLLTIVTICGSIIEGAVYPLYYTYTLTLKNRLPAIVTVLSGVCNVLAMYVLISAFDAGIFCVVTTTAVLSWLVNFGFTPVYAARCLGQKATIFFSTLVRHIFSCCVITGVFALISQYMYPQSWFGLVGVAIPCAAIGALLHVVLVCNRSEISKICSVFCSRFFVK